MTAKKILFWVWVLLTILGIIGGITWLQLLPILIIETMLLLEIYKKKETFIPAMILSIFMLVLNLSLSAMWDCLLWGATIAVYLFNN